MFIMSLFLLEIFLIIFGLLTGNVQTPQSLPFKTFLKSLIFCTLMFSYTFYCSFAWIFTVSLKHLNPCVQPFCLCFKCLFLGFVKILLPTLPNSASARYYHKPFLNRSFHSYLFFLLDGCSFLSFWPFFYF